MKRTIQTITGFLFIFMLGFAFIYPWGNINASYNAPISTSAVPSSVPQWIKITKSYTDFSTAGATNTITITTLPAKSVVEATVVRPATSFTGGLISAYTISIGMNTAVDLMPASSSFTVPTNPFASGLTVAGTFGSTQAITATAIAATGLLNAATQGSVEIDLLVSQTP